MLRNTCHFDQVIISISRTLYYTKLLQKVIYIYILTLINMVWIGGGVNLLQVYNSTTNPLPITYGTYPKITTINSVRDVTIETTMSNTFELWNSIDLVLWANRRVKWIALPSANAPIKRNRVKLLQIKREKRHQVKSWNCNIGLIL